MKNVKKTWVALALMGCMQVLHAQTVYLHSDNPQMRWKLKPQAEVGTDVKSLCENGYNVSAWVDAVVPGTAFNSYVIAGLEKDPNFGDNIHQVNRDKYDRSFWYRTTFRVPADFTKELIWLNFNGVNRRAEVYLNGTLLGKLDGFMHRGHFNVTSLVNRDKENVLAVLVHIPDTPLANQGSPTYLSSGGWDWMPYVPGLNSGITDKVFLTNTGTATLIDPWIRTNLPTRARADLSVALDVKNNSVEKTKVLVRGTITPGNIIFQKELEVNAHTTEQVKFDKRYFPQLCIDQPRLWWPKGYGAPHLYDVEFCFETDGKVTDKTSFKSGVRQMTYSEETYKPSGGMSVGSFGQSEPQRLSLFINGRRFIGFGGNWGFGESNLNYREREYDIAVAYHADMNFTMIRNWVGQIGDKEFYEACDRHGIMVWQDFWLANPVDGPNPYYTEMFNANACDYLKRIRNHPSIGIYVGRNEGNPPAGIDDYLRGLVFREHPGLYYISNSAMGVVSGGGPYRALSPKSYFQSYGHDKFHSERGMPNVMNYESMLLTFGTDKIEPVNTSETPNPVYGLHDYTLGGGKGSSAQAASSFNDMIEKAFGRPRDAKQFAEWAQWINYDGYRAIFEGRSEHRRGMLLWMSHSAWPSMVWQTYDYYFDPNAAYFGCKKASEPLHIQWNPLRDDIEVVNYHAFDRTGLTATASLFNQDGTLQWTRETKLDIKEDQTVACFPLEQPETLSDTYFIKLSLTDSDGKQLSDNFYWRGKEDGNYKSLLQLPKVSVCKNVTVKKTGKEWLIRAVLKNEARTPALMLRLKVAGEKSGRMLLPVFYSDNYFSLLPGEVKEVDIRLYDADTYGEKPVLEVLGFNL